MRHPLKTTRTNTSKIPEKEPSQTLAWMERFCLPLTTRHQHHFIADCGERLLEAFAGQFPDVTPLEEVVRLRREWANGCLFESAWKLALQEAHNATRLVLPHVAIEKPELFQPECLLPLQRALFLASTVFLAEPKDVLPTALRTAQAISTASQDPNAYELELLWLSARVTRYALHPNASFTQEDTEQQLRTCDTTIQSFCALFPIKIRRLFVNDCAERVLHIYEKQYPGDDRLHIFVQARRQFAENKIFQREYERARQNAQKAALQASRQERKTDHPTRLQRAATAAAKAVSLELKHASEAVLHAALAVHFYTDDFVKFVQERSWQFECAHRYLKKAATSFKQK